MPTIADVTTQTKLERQQHPVQKSTLLTDNQAGAQQANPYALRFRPQGCGFPGGAELMAKIAATDTALVKQGIALIDAETLYDAKAHFSR